MNKVHPLLYLSPEYRADLLYNQYLKHKALIIAVDYDSTICPYHPEEYQCNYENILEILRKAKNDFGFKIVLFSTSNPGRYPDMANYCAERGLVIDGINENLLPQYDGHGKIYYNLLLDDKAGLAEALHILTMLMFKINNQLKLETTQTIIENL